MTMQRGAARALLEVEGLTVRYPGPGRSRTRAAVTELDLSVYPGESVGLVGGSGAGKSTMAKALAGLVQPEQGRITLAGRDLLGCPSRTARRLRRPMHLVMQDPYASLPPNRQVAATVAEPLVIHGLVDRRMRRRLVVETLDLVRLRPCEEYLRRYPHQLSGGERQRVAFARALIAEPQLVLADEPTQMLDASLRGELVDLLGQLCARRRMAVLHITHDLALAQRGCHRLVVLRDGVVVEHGPTERVLGRPRHPYTAALVAAATGSEAA